MNRAGLRVARPAAVLEAIRRHLQLRIRAVVIKRKQGCFKTVLKRSFLRHQFFFIWNEPNICQGRLRTTNISAEKLKRRERRFCAGTCTSPDPGQFSGRTCRRSRSWCDRLTCCCDWLARASRLAYLLRLICTYTTRLTYLVLLRLI